MTDPTPPPPPPVPAGPLPAAPRRKRRWLRRIVGFLVVVLLLATFAPLALGLAPVRKFVAARLSKSLGRTTTIGGASGSWWGGFELRDLEIHNPAGWTGAPLLAMDRVHVAVRLLPLLTGGLDVSVAVDRPVVTLVRAADGRSNADGLLPDEPDAARAPRARRERGADRGAQPAIAVTLRDGRIVAHDLSAPAGSTPQAQEIDAITLDASADAHGAKVAAFSAIARRAAPGGTDARITLDAKLSAKEGGPIALSVPRLDLARLSKVVALMTGLEDLSGTFEANARLAVDGAHRVAGTVGASLARLSARRGERTFSLASADVELRPTIEGSATAFDLRGALKDVRLAGRAGTQPWDDPAITFAAKGAWDETTKRLTLASGSVASASGSVQWKPGFVVDAGARRGVSGELALDADFARLTSLRPLVEALDSVRSGRLHAEAKLASGETTRAEWSVRADGLVFAPGVLSSGGWSEPAAVVRGTFETTASGDSVVSLDELTSSLVALARAERGLRVRLSDAGPSVESPGTLTVRLEPLSRALDRALGLAPGERLGGTLDLVPTGTTTDGGASFSVGISGRDLRFPGSTAPGTLTGRVDGRTDRATKTTTIDTATLDGYGLTVKADAALGPDTKGATSLRRAHATLRGDLAAARPLLGVALGLAPDATLAGTLASEVTLTPAGATRVAKGRTTLERLVFVGGRDPKSPAAAPARYDDPSVVVEHDLTLDALGPDSLRLDRVTLTSSTGSASVTGSSKGSRESRAVDLVATLDLDGARFGERLRNLLGAGYEDTVGEGRITGKVVLVGPLGDRMRDLRIDGTLATGRFTSGGLSLENGALRIVRPNPATPVAITLTSGVNRGTLRVDGTCDLGRGENPWTAKVLAKGLDTSPLLTNRGAGKWLTMVLPAIVPAQATSNVLSGLLDADLDLRSDATGGARMTDTLTGPGSIRMSQGSVKDSTIFSSLAGDGAGKGLSTLVSLAPGLGSELSSLSKALLFQSLASTFAIGSRRIDLRPVELVSPKVELRFSGSVGFDGTTDLRIPLKLGGEAGRAIERYLPDRTIPLKVGGKTGALRVQPELDASKLLQGGLLDGGLEKGKDVLDGLLGGKKKKPK